MKQDSPSVYDMICDFHKSTISTYFNVQNFNVQLFLLNLNFGEKEICKKSAPSLSTGI